MSSIQTGRESPTELCLEYKELVARKLIIVIHGLPTADHDAYTPGAAELPKPSPAGSKHSRSHGSPSSPLIEEVEAINDATGYAPALFTPLLLAAWRGQEALALELIAAMIEEETAENAGRATVLTEYAKAVLYNGLGRYEHAVAAAQRACACEDLGFFGWARLELVEAGARSHARTVATGALRDLDERTRASGTDWALGVRARSAALLSDGTAAELRFICPEHSSCTASGFVVRTGAWTRASSFEPLTTRSAASQPRRLRSEPVVSSLPPGRPRAAAPTTRATSSRPKRHR